MGVFIARRIRARSRLAGSVLVAATGVLALVIRAPAVSAEHVGPSPVDGVGGVAQTDQAPTIAVEPSTGLSRGQTVTVTGSGFAPGSSVGVAMCQDPVVDRSSCDLSTTQAGLSDDAGGFTLAYEVTDTVNGRSCVPMGCVIGMANPDPSDESANPVGLGRVAGLTHGTSVRTPAGPSIPPGWPDSSASCRTGAPRVRRQA